MQEIIKLGEELKARVVRETDVMIAERCLLRDIVENRGRELQRKCEEELRRIEGWAEGQKQVVREVFHAMISENEADKLKHEAAIARLYGESLAPPLPSVSANVMPMRQAEPENWAINSRRLTPPNA
jgi:hypothetical protein